MRGGGGLKIRRGAKGFRCVTPKVGKEGVALNVGENAASHLTNQHAPGSSAFFLKYL